MDNDINGRPEESQHLARILEEYREGQEASRVLAAASYHLRTSHRGDEEQGAVQNPAMLLSAIESEARKEGIWVDDPASIVGEQLGYGQENTVYFTKDGKNVIKFYSLKMLNDGQDCVELIARINAHNQFAANVPYRIIGFAKDKSGQVGALLQQPYIQGAMEADQYSIDSYLQEAGYIKATLSNGKRGWTNGTFEIWDVVPRNVLMDIWGNLYFIDANIKKH